MFDSLKKMFEKNAKTISLKAVEDGRTIPMDEVNDQTFAQELLGPGIAIVPSNGTVVSPINGTIATVMDTKHAVCIQGEDGLELIVHAGLDTVELNGKYYQTYKGIGDQVKAGDVLLEFDLEEITKEVTLDTLTEEGFEYLIGHGPENIKVLIKIGEEK